MSESIELDAVQVAVVIPAYNAAATIAETLDSVINQTHRNLDIMVVDDGSTDRTREIAEDYTERDSRVRVISQPNGGVARARNAGIAATSAEFVAPVDADDLWHPDKIRLQLETMLAGSPDTGFVYSPYRQVDEAGNCLSFNSARDRIEGTVFLQHCLVNFVGNGSGMLVRRAAIKQAGGYDPSLHDCGLQGTEDWLLQIIIARHWQVKILPLYLVGYRQRRGSMSADRQHMLRVCIATRALLEKCCTNVPGELLRGQRAEAHAALAWQSLKAADFLDARRALSDAIAASPVALTQFVFDKAVFAIQRRLERVFRTQPEVVPRPFADVAPDEGVPGQRDKRTRRRLQRLSRYEAL